MVINCVDVELAFDSPATNEQCEEIVDWLHVTGKKLKKLRLVGYLGNLGHILDCLKQVTTEYFILALKRFIARTSCNQPSIAFLMS